MYPHSIDLIVLLTKNVKVINKAEIKRNILLQKQADIAEEIKKRKRTYE